MGLATLLLDLLDLAEEAVDLETREMRFDIPLLGRRLTAAADWLDSEADTAGLPVGCFGASTGAAAAIFAAVERPRIVRSVVCRGGRPDLADDMLSRLTAPTLLIVGGNDVPVVRLNERAAALMGNAEHAIHVVPGATHLFEEPGAIEQVARDAGDWFLRTLSIHPV